MVVGRNIVSVGREVPVRYPSRASWIFPNMVIEMD